MGHVKKRRIHVQEGTASCYPRICAGVMKVGVAKGSGCSYPNARDLQSLGELYSVGETTMPFITTQRHVFIDKNH